MVNVAQRITRCIHMKLKSNKVSHLDKSKHLVRGAISRLRTPSSPNNKLKEWQQEQIVQIQINKALSEAKKHLRKSQLADFEKWVAVTIGEQNRLAKRIGTQITSLGFLPSELEPRDLVTELELALVQIDRQHSSMLLFLDDAIEIVDSITSRDWANASSRLQQSVSQNGYSYWAIETELALSQASEGVESLKTHVSTMSISSGNINKFLIYFFGVRNEPAQTSARFKVNTKRRVEDSDLSAELQTYLIYRLHGGLETNQSGLAAVLAYEQLTTPIDLLFTLVKVVRLILAQKKAFSIASINAAEKADELLLPFTEKLRIFGEVQQSQIAEDFGERGEFDSYLLTIARRAIQGALRPTDKLDPTTESYDEFVVHGLTSLLSTRSRGVLGEELAKHLLNLNWLPVAIQIGDVSSVPLLPKILLTHSELESNQPLNIYDALCFAVGTLSHSRDCSEEGFETILKLTLTKREEYVEEVVKLANSFDVQLGNGVSVDVARVILAHYFYGANNTPECLKISVQAGLENNHIVSLLPLAELFQGVKWASLRQYSTLIDLAIALGQFLLVIDDRKVRTYKRYAIEDLMKHHKVVNVDDLPDALIAAKVDVGKIEILMSQGCDIPTLELLPGMGDSKKVLLVRKKILLRLAALQTNHELEHLHESEEIDDDLQVNDGLSVLDDSKVYVDEQTILNFVNKEMVADFQRYLNLVKNGIGISESLSDVLKGYKNPNAQTFQIPKNDADDLLVEILSSVLDRFLFDPASGLDIIIGRRIRHGTIASEIRGYLESVELIGQKPRAGAEYDAPMRVNTLLLNQAPKRRRIIIAAFSRYCESIDQHIALLRDEYFHVKSQSKPRGIFELQLTPVVLSLARSIAQTCESIEQFSKECFAIFWFFLSVRTDAARPAIESEIKKTLNSIVVKFNNELKSLDVEDLEFLAMLQQASEELQRRAATIASWIRVPKNNIEGAAYSIQRVVDVAVAMVSGQRPGFSPNVTTALPESLLLDTHGFSIIVDALYIALDNICQHSGKKVDNKIHIIVQFDSASSLISFDITNEVTASSRTSEKEARINSTRADIQKRIYRERARQDRGSGLSKLAAIVMQSEKTSITFGYLGANQFQLKFDLVYVSTVHSSNQTPLATESLLSTYEVDQ